MSNRSADLLLSDIITSIEKIMLYTAGYDYESFIADAKTVDAVIRNFEIIGEAASRLPDEIKDTFSVVDWHRLRGFRNRIVHDYMGIDYGLVWRIIETNLDQLHIEIYSIIQFLNDV